MENISVKYIQQIDSLRNQLKELEDFEGITEEDNFNGFIQLLGFEAELYIDIEFKKTGAKIIVCPPAVPFTKDLLIEMNDFNAMTNFKVFYFERYLNFVVPEFEISKECLLDIISIKLANLLTNEMFLDLMRKYLKFYECPKCGCIVELIYPYDSQDYVYECNGCGERFSIKEITGIEDYIDEYK